MSKGTTTSIVFATGGILVTIPLVQKGSLGSGKAYRKIWAAGLFTAALAVFADFVPELVGPFAVLVILAAVANDTGVLGGLIAGNKSSSVNPAVNPSASGPVKP